uniref:TRAM domain-containing protein n=1 Tax=Dictyoglomus turgidum TaxID=513050 RepID=A0A7C3WNW6_9BACT
MVEEKENDVFRGTTDNYIKVEFKGPFYLKEGDYVKVILEDIDKEKSKVYAKLVKDELKIG